jgi:hypothetical protein
MKKSIKISLTLALAVAAWIWSGDVRLPPEKMVATAEAVIGRPLTPVSYAGVARRTTVRVATPGVGTPWNRGGPVNRVGRR